MIRRIILSFGLLLIVGCGAQSNPDTQDSSTVSDDISNLISENNSSVSTTLAIPVSPIVAPAPEATEAPETEPTEVSLLPKKINIDFPTLLKSDYVEDTNSTKEENGTLEENSSSVEENDLGYLQLKKSISKIDAMIDLAQINLLVLDQVMPEVQERCEGMISCLFKKKSLSVVLDNETISSINMMISESNRSIEDDNMSEVSFGELGLYHYDENESYQYMLTLNVLDSSLYQRDPSIKKEFQTIKWSENNKDVLTIYDYEDNESNNSITLYYLTDEEGKETMHVYSKDDSQKIGYQENTSLVLSKIEDGNGSESNSSYSLTSNSILKHSLGEDNNVSSFSSNIEIVDDSSLLLFSGSTTDEDSGDEVVVSSEFSCDNNESCDQNSSEDNEELYDNINLFELRIVGGNLKDGDYLLLAPDTNIESLNMITIFEESLGRFTVFGGEKQGALHRDGFLYMLNSLMIVYMNPSQESTTMFEIVDVRDKPTLRIVK